MKTLLLTLGLMAAFVRAGYAVEYVTLLRNEEISVSPTSTIELVRKDNYSYPTVTLNRDMPNNPGIREFDLSGPVVGAVKVRNSASQDWSYVTLKITPANELNVVAPTSLLVLPEGSTGNYNIVVETSDDTTTWTPFHSQTVSATDAKRFFRTRIVKAQ